MEEKKYKNLQIKEVSPADILHHLPKMSTEHVAPPKFPFSGKYIGAYVDGKLVGCVGWFIKGKTIRYRTDYVLPNYRKAGIYTALFLAREDKCAKLGMRTTAFCTSRSRGMYLRSGFVCKSDRDKEIKFVYRNPSN